MRVARRHLAQRAHAGSRRAKTPLGARRRRGGRASPWRYSASSAPSRLDRAAAAPAAAAARRSWGPTQPRARASRRRESRARAPRSTGGATARARCLGASVTRSSSASVLRIRSSPCLSQNVSAMASHSCPASTNCNRWNRLWPTAPWYSAKNFLRSSGCRVRRPSRWLRSTFWNTSWRSVERGRPARRRSFCASSNAHSACSVPSSFSSHSVVCVTSRPSLVRCASFDKKSTVSFTESDPGRFGSGNGDAGDAVDEGASEALVSPSFVSFDSPSFASPSFASSSSASRAASPPPPFSRAASAPGRSLPPRRPGLLAAACLRRRVLLLASPRPWRAFGRLRGVAARPRPDLGGLRRVPGLALGRRGDARGDRRGVADGARRGAGDGVVRPALDGVQRRHERGAVRVGVVDELQEHAQEELLVLPPDGITREAIRDTHRDMTCAAEPFGRGTRRWRGRARRRAAEARASPALAWFSSCVSLDSSLTRCGR